MTSFTRAIAQVAAAPEDYRPNVRLELWADVVQFFADTVTEDDTSSEDMGYDGRDHAFADNEAASADGDDWYINVPGACSWVGDALSEFGTDILFTGSDVYYSRREVHHDPLGRLQEMGVYMEARDAWAECAGVMDALATEIADEAEAA